MYIIHMAYSKKYTPKKKVYRKKYNLVKAVKAITMRQAETKHKITVQTEVNTPELNSPQLAYSLVDLTRGSFNNNRVGNEVQGIGIDLRGHVMNNSITVGDLTRIIVYQKNSPMDNFLVDGFENNTGNFAPANVDTSAIWARTNGDKYRILKNMVINTYGRSNGQGHYFKQFRCWIPLKGANMKYDDSSQFCQNKDILVCFITRNPNNDDVGGATEVSFNAKFYYKDM